LLICCQKRENKAGKQLDEDEAHEEDYEFKEASHFYARDDLKGSDNFRL